MQTTTSTNKLFISVVFPKYANVTSAHLGGEGGGAGGVSHTYMYEAVLGHLLTKC